MAIYSIEWKHSARKELKKLPKYLIPKILITVEGLIEHPFPKGRRKIIGAKHIYRIRVSDYRIVYSINSYKLVIEIIRVSHRKNVYKNLT